MSNRRRRGRQTAVAGVVLAAVLAGASAASAATVQVTTSGDDATCARDGGACRSLVQAVAIAQAGDVVQFGAGAFPITPPGGNGVEITKQLDLRGNQYGVDARTRSVGGPAETVLSELGATPVQGLVNIQEGAAGTSVRGFTISGTSGNPNHAGAGVLTAPNGADGGYRISENIITDNTIGLFLNASGAPTVISENVFLANVRFPNLPAAGNGLYAERATNVTIADNRFQDNQQTGSIDAYREPTGADVTFTGNESVNEAGMSFTQIDGLTVSGNTMTGGGFRAFTLGGHGLRDATLSGNVITGKQGEFANAIRLTNFRGGEQNSDVTISENTITGTSSSDPTRGNAIWLTPNGAGGDVRVARNRIVDNSGDGIRNEDPDTEVNANGNWWGCNLGPGFAGCDDAVSPAGAGVDAGSWLTLSLSADPAEIDAGASSSLLARLANLSGGGLAGGPFFATAVAEFASTPGGTHTPPSVPLPGSDLTATSAFTAAERPQEVRVTVDNETVRVANSDPPEPIVVPDIVPAPDDQTLTPGERVEIVVEIVNRGNAPARRIRACTRLSEKLDRSGERCRQIARLGPGQSVIFRLIARARTNACRGPVVARLRVLVAGQPAKVRRAVSRLLAGPCGPPQPCPAAARATGAPRASTPADRPPRAHMAC